MRRRRVPELMDQPGVDYAAHAAALASLARTNRWLGADRSLERAIASLAGGSAGVLDIGCGGGGLLLRLASRKDGVLDAHSFTDKRMHARHPLIGIDVSRQALAIARARCDAAIAWVCADARMLPFADASIDLVTCALTLHHFDPPDATRILAEAARVCRRGVVISDLARSRAALVATWLTTRLVSRSSLFRVDGPRSVRAAYRADELARIAGDAGLRSFSIWRQFPFRLLLNWRKNPSGAAG